MNRDFKGINIPLEILSDENLKHSEMILWAYIHEFYKEQHGGCKLANDDLSLIMGLEKSRICQILAKLRSLALLKNISFDGRTRIMKAVLPVEESNVK